MHTSRAVAALSLLCTAAIAPAARAAPLQVEVDAGAGLRAVSPRLFGTNLEPKDQSDLIVRDLVASLGITAYRYPGGGWPGWHWQTGTFDNEPVFDDCALGGVDYLKGFLADVGGELLVQVNVETGTAAEAAAMRGWMRAQGVRGDYFELGNEVYGDWDAGYRTSSAYVTTIQSFAAALRGADPAVRIGADVGGPAYDSWDRAVVGGACSEIDFLSFHWYPGRLTTETPLHVMGNSLAVPVMVQHFRDVLAATCPTRADAIEIGFLEWDGVFDHDTTGMRQTLANAILYADAFGQMATSGVTLSFHYETAGRTYGLFDGYDPNFTWHDTYDGRVRPKAFALQLASALGGGDLVATTVTGAATYTNSPSDPNWEYGGVVPYQAAYASRHADRLVLLLVSRHPDTAAPATISLTGFDPEGTAVVRTLTGPSLTASNEAGAGTVAITSGTVAVAPTFDFTLPPRSVVLLEIPERQSVTPADAGVAADAGAADAAPSDAGVARDAAARGDAALDAAADAPTPPEPADAGVAPVDAARAGAGGGPGSGSLRGGCDAAASPPGLVALAALLALALHRRRRA